MHFSAAALSIAALPALVVASSRLQKRLDNGLALTPPMGWNSYNHYNCAPNQSIILSNAEAVVSLGLADLGYTYVTTDCGWTIPHRTANNTLTWNETLFPDGFPSLGQHIHDLGLHFGVYSDGGVQMCMTGGVNQTGSLGHEDTDAANFVSWGADLLKYDNCYSSAERGYPNTDYAPLVSPRDHYITMQNALNKTGKDLLFQICDWGVDFPALWAPDLGNTFRVTNDIIPAWRTIFRIVNQVVPQTDFAGPGHWLDLDMLEVGNNIFNHEEEKTHFSLWAIFKSPLTIGCALNDTLTSINEDSLAILKNEQVIALNQDSLGVAANLSRRWSDDGYDVWSGPLSGNRTVAALVDWNNFSIDATLDLPVIGLQSAGWVKDAWTNVTRGNVYTSYTAKVAAHGTLLLELGDTTPAGTYKVDNHDGGSVTISNIYGITTSSAYTLHVHFSNLTCSSTQLSLRTEHGHSTHSIPSDVSSHAIPLTLTASNNNTITLSHPRKIESITVENPTGTFYPATAFEVSGTAKHTNCTTGLCSPVGAKITDITPNSSATLYIPSSNSTSTTATTRFVNIHYINNEVSLATSWEDGRNARNITISVNDNAPVRLEAPLSGRSSELFSPMRGWGDPAVLGVLVGGFGDGVDGQDKVVIGNVGGEKGVQSYGADFVGIEVL